VDPSALDPNLVEAFPQILLTYRGVVDEQTGELVNTPLEEDGISWAGLGFVHPLQLPQHPEGLLNAPFYVEQLPVLWAPVALKTYADGTSEEVFDPQEIPRGAWEIFVIQPDGSFWYIPNSLASAEQWIHAQAQPWEPARQGEYLIVTD